MRNLLLTLFLLCSSATVAQEHGNARLYGMPVIWPRHQNVETPGTGGPLLPGGTLGGSECVWTAWDLQAWHAALNYIVALASSTPCGNDVLEILWLILTDLELSQ